MSYGSNGFAFGITAGGNYGKGYGNGDETSWLASKVGSLQSQTSLSSQQETNIKGSQVLGNKINLTAQNLNIESLQDTMTYKGKQMNASGQVTVGYGFSASGSYNQSQVNADYASVKTQAGLFAGDEGFDVEVGNKINLIGGAILSTADQERNLLSANKFSFTDIKNYSMAKASSSGFGMGFSINRDQTSAEDRKNNEIYRSKKEKQGETFEKANPNQANRSPVQFGLGTNDVHSADFYALAKIGVTNLLSNTKKSENDVSITSSLISEGKFTIKDPESLENTYRINKSTKEQNNSLEKTDYHGLQKEVEGDLSIKRAFFSNVAGLTDEAYRKMFIAEHRMLTAKVDKEGNPIKDKDLENALDDEARKFADTQLKKGKITKEEYHQTIINYKEDQLGKGRNIYELREVSDQERQNLKQVTYTDPLTGKSETRYVVAFNGIFNDENAAAKFAWQNYVAQQGKSGKIDTRIYKDVYFVHHPEANNFVSELLVAGYEKMFEGSFGNILGMDNSSLQAKDIMTRYGKDNLFIGSHSRGTLTITNALNALDTQENRDAKLLSGTKIKMVGPAANVTHADKVLSKLQTGKERSSSEGSIRIENHEQDPVGSIPLILGGNPATMNDNTKNRQWGERIADMFGNDSSMHNCYGLGQKQCVKDGYRKEEDLLMNKEQTIYDLNKKQGEKK
ncbi:hypothetical protein B0186_00590 [Canicola haemoglobinophilus]|uniref:Filamentous hemagglutinin outer membrane protein n=1 Tax=Canicola haemoglobinophilus TaxID=733 RepID=A0A1V4B415_9PAST|nr:hypothetical protein B0186_00590 [Canicola haemoglobinophilus]STO59561.1 filamentous hemagglutinin outer membrane protein [Canicola haemoglobinophilus]